MPVFHGGWHALVSHGLHDQQVLSLGEDPSPEVTPATEVQEYLIQPAGCKPETVLDFLECVTWRFS